MTLNTVRLGLASREGSGRAPASSVFLTSRPLVMPDLVPTESLALTAVQPQDEADWLTEVREHSVPEEYVGSLTGIRERRGFL